MDILTSITEAFVTESRKILGEDLVGVYLHGSAVTGCFNEKKSDIDLLVVVNETIPDTVKRQYMDMVVMLNKDAPRKGIEMSIVRKAVCRSFIYPTPFELHFSIAHSDWYDKDPSGYIAKMNGTDKDLAAHFTIIWHSGRCLYGEAIQDVFENVREEFFLDSIWNDVADAEERISEDPAYMILNLCRVLAYVKERLILSKQEGGNWGLTGLPVRYHDLILSALNDRLPDSLLGSDAGHAREFAAYMIDQIDTGRLCATPRGTL